MKDKVKGESLNGKTESNPIVNTSDLGNLNQEDLIKAKEKAARLIELAADLKQYLDSLE